MGDGTMTFDRDEARMHALLEDRKGADPSEWPSDLRVREMLR